MTIGQQHLLAGLTHRWPQRVSISRQIDGLLRRVLRHLPFFLGNKKGLSLSWGQSAGRRLAGQWGVGPDLMGGCDGYSS